jgi:hypothetical protein
MGLIRKFEIISNSIPTLAQIDETADIFGVAELVL